MIELDRQKSVIYDELEKLERLQLVRGSGID